MNYTLDSASYAAAEHFFDVRGAMAKAFQVPSISKNSDSVSRANGQIVFRTGISKVISKQSSKNSDGDIIDSIRSFADFGPDDRMISIRNYFLRALAITFPKIRPDSALAIATIKALVTNRESGGTVTWTLEGSTPFVGGVDRGWKNMRQNQTYGGNVSGTGLIQWTAGRHRTFFARMKEAATFKQWSYDLACIDPGMQAMYWAAELAEHSGMNGAINGGSESGAHFSPAFKKVLNGEESINLGEIYGALMLWQMGAGFGRSRVSERQELIFGNDGFVGLSRRTGLTAFDLAKARELGMRGLFLESHTLTVRDFCNGIRKYVNGAHKYEPQISHFYFSQKRNPSTGKINTFKVGPDEDLLAKFNLK